MRKRTIVRLHIFGEATPELLDAQLGIRCDSSWRKGDRRGRTLIIEKENGWSLDSGLPESESLENHCRALLERLSGHYAEIRKVSESDSVELSCVLYSDSPPALNFERSVMEAVSLLGASLDIDLYIIPE